MDSWQGDIFGKADDKNREKLNIRPNIHQMHNCMQMSYHEGERKGVNGDSSSVVVHSKNAAFDNSHVSGPDSMVPEEKKRETDLKMCHKIHFYSAWSCKCLLCKYMDI